MKTWNRNTIDLKEYKYSKTVIHCDTEEKANDLLKYLDEQGIIWRVGDRLTENNYWDDYEEQTCYNCNYENVLTYGSKYTYKHNIIEWEIVEFKSLNNKEYNDSEVENMKCNVKNFDIERFKTGNYAIHCNTEEKARKLLNYLDKEHCITWSHRLNNKYTAWKTFHEKTCYSYDASDGTLRFCNYEYYKKNGTIIYEFEFQYPLTWIDFKLDNIVIHCKTDSQVNELSQWIYSNKDEEFAKEPLLCLAEGWNRYHNEVCYNYNLSEKKIKFGTENTYLYKNYEVVEWDGKNLYEINGTIETDMDIDELNDKFINFIESINGEFAGGIK